MPDPTDLARLRSRIAALEGMAGGDACGSVPLGVAEIDEALPGGGLALGALHEVAPVRHPDGIEDGAALGFAAFALGRLAVASGKPVLWVGSGDEPHAPGLAGLGLVPGRLVLARAYKPAEVLWAMEEGLRCRALAAVLAESWRLDLTAARRLQLAARASGVAAILFNHGPAPGPAVTRWQVAAAPGTGDPALGVGPWRWRLDLLRCRGRAVGDDGRVAAWEVEWNDETRGLRLAAPAGDRAVAPHRLRAAG